MSHSGYSEFSTLARRHLLQMYNGLKAALKVDMR